MNLSSNRFLTLGAFGNISNCLSNLVLIDRTKLTSLSFQILLTLRNPSLVELLYLKAPSQKVPISRRYLVLKNLAMFSYNLEILGCQISPGCYGYTPCPKLVSFDTLRIWYIHTLLIQTPHSQLLKLKGVCSLLRNK